MGLLSHGIAVGIGYLLGSPQGRQRLNQVGGQVAELGRRPEVARLTERGKSVAVEQVEAVKQKVLAKTKDAAADEGEPTGDKPARRVPGGLRLSTIRLRRRSANAHFPPSEGAVKPAPLGGTTVIEDSEAALRGGKPTPRTEPPTSTNGG